MSAKALHLVPGCEPFPGYRLKHFLGRGGWGEVWQADNPQGQACALKFLPCADRQGVYHEVRALQAIRKLNHPNLLRIEQIWCCAGYLVIAMELADGSLMDLLDISIQDL